MQWVTAERVQVDRLASAWLIRRFVDSEASFAFVPRGTGASAVAEGTPFYLPGAALGRQGEQSTFETIVAEYQLAPAHPALAEMGRLVRATDALHGPVAFRGASVREALAANAPPETAGLQLLLHGVRLQSGDDDTAVATAIIVLDAAYAALQARVQAPDKA